MNCVDKMQGKPLNPMLRMAALAGVDMAVKLHIMRGDDLDARDGSGMTPLMLAASKNRASVCSLLIEAGADLGLCDASGRDALSIALAAGATAAAEVLTAAIARSEPELIESSLAGDLVVAPNWVRMVSLDDDWEVEDSGNWEADEEKPPPEGDSSIAEGAAAIHKSISRHVPIDDGQDWADFDVLLPEMAVRPMVQEESSDALRELLTRAMREGAVPEENVLRVCSEDGAVDEARERIVGALLAEIGVLPDERDEDGIEPFIAEATDDEQDTLSSLLAYADDLDPWRCDPARVYTKEIRIGRLLTAEEEVLLGKEMEEGLALASKSLASWPAGLDALAEVRESVMSGREDVTEDAVAGHDEPNEDIFAQDSADDEDEVGDDAGQEFLAVLGEVSRLRNEGKAGSAAMVAALDRAKLAPSFLVGLSARAKNDQEATVFKSAIERYAKARETMIVCNLRMVYNVVKRYQGFGLPFDDLLQEGNIGLMKAVERYDWRRGFKFSTYATWWIKQSSSRAVANSGRTIRLPVHVNNKLSVIRRAIDVYESRYGASPSDMVLAGLVSMPIITVAMLRVRMEEPVPIHEADTDESLWEEALSDDPDSRPEAVAERMSLIQALGRALADLDERSLEILTLRYGLDGTDPRTLEETGEHYGLTRERIRQIEAKALRKLAHPLRSSALVPFLYPDRLKEKAEEDVETDRSLLREFLVAGFKPLPGQVLLK